MNVNYNDAWKKLSMKNNVIISVWAVSDDLSLSLSLSFSLYFFFFFVCVCIAARKC